LSKKQRNFFVLLNSDHHQQHGSNNNNYYALFFHFCTQRYTTARKKNCKCLIVIELRRSNRAIEEVIKINNKNKVRKAIQIEEAAKPVIIAATVAVKVLIMKINIISVMDTDSTVVATRTIVA